MSIPKKEKQYGLLLPKKPQLSAPRAGNVFCDDNDSDEEEGTDWVQKALRAEGEKHRIKKQTQLSMQKALKEDPSIYQYDEVYDEIERTKAEGKSSKKVEKKPKYVHNLIKAAERRKREQEHRIERMVQKEREAEGAMFADKESFVTSAYRAKLEEFKQMEEEESRMERLEAMADVTKQQDMSSFYRHLYKQTQDGGKEEEVEKPSKVQAEKNDETDDNKNFSKESFDDKDDSSVADSTDSNADCEKPVAEKSSKSPAKGKKERHYRKRVIEASEPESNSEDEQKKIEEIPLRNSKDAKEVEKPPCKVSKNDGETKNNKCVLKDSKDDENEKEKTEEEKKSGDKPEDPELLAKIEAKKKLEEKKKKKESIWVKRTVGPVFEAALQRYYARKALKSSGS